MSKRLELLELCLADRMFSHVKIQAILFMYINITARIFRLRINSINSCNAPLYCIPL